MNNGERPIVNPYVVLREEFDDWAILFNPDTGRGFGLSPTGVYLWKLLDGRHALDALLEYIRSHVDNVPQDASDHIKAFVYGLVAEGLAASDWTLCGLLDNADRTGLHLEQGSYSPPEAVGAMKMLTYEPPKLVDLRGHPVSGSCCNSGSSDTGYCSSGGCADYDCSGGSSTSLGWCQGGTSAYGKCCTGTSPGWWTGCTPGSCQSRIYCNCSPGAAETPAPCGSGSGATGC